MNCFVMGATGLKSLPGFCIATETVQECKDSTAMRLLYKASIGTGLAAYCENFARDIVV
jgi:hypothetical protein